MNCKYVSILYFFVICDISRGASSFPLLLLLLLLWSLLWLCVWESIGRFIDLMFCFQTHWEIIKKRARYTQSFITNVYVYVAFPSGIFKANHCQCVRKKCSRVFNFWVCSFTSYYDKRHEPENVISKAHKHYTYIWLYRN